MVNGAKQKVETPEKREGELRLSQNHPVIDQNIQ